MKNKHEQKMRLLQLKSSMIASVVGFYTLNNFSLAMNQNLTDTQFADQLDINKKYQDNLIQEIINHEI